jgi:hypothetical protein
LWLIDLRTEQIRIISDERDFYVNKLAAEQATKQLKVSIHCTNSSLFAGWLPGSVRDLLRYSFVKQIDELEQTVQQQQDEITQLREQLAAALRSHDQ